MQYTFVRFIIWYEYLLRKNIDVNFFRYFIWCSIIVKKGIIVNFNKRFQSTIKIILWRLATTNWILVRIYFYVLLTRGADHVPRSSPTCYVVLAMVFGGRDGRGCFRLIYCWNSGSIPTRQGLETSVNSLPSVCLRRDLAWGSEKVTWVSLLVVCFKLDMCNQSSY